MLSTANKSNSTKSSSAGLIKFAPYFVLTTLALLLIFAVFPKGFYANHDGIFHIYRIEEAWNMLKAGQFPLRWAGNFDQGFGIPLFTFIYPLPYYLGAVLYRFLGSIWALKLSVASAYVLSGWGMYTLFSKRGVVQALFLALLYLMTPYLFLNIFVRGALGEVWALAIIPWVFVAMNNLQSSQKLRWYHPLPLGFLLIAHNFLGILFTGFLVGKIFLTKGFKKSRIASLLISIGLASFFILPMFFQKNLLYSFENKDLTFRYDQHFVYLRQFLYGKWDYWYSIDGPNDGMSFQLGVAQMLVAFLGALAIILNRKRTTADLYLILAYLGSIFLMTSHSKFIWEKLSLLQSVQFPWRLLFMPAVLTPLLGAHALDLFKNKKLISIVMLVILIVGFWNVRNYRRPIKYLDLTDYTDLYRLYYNKTSTTFRTEILPKWSGPSERYKSDELLVNSGNMIIDSLSFDSLSLKATINNKPDPAEARVTLLRNFYPGWQLIMDGSKKIELKPGNDGMISFTPELGTHTYTLTMVNTPLEKLANLISLLSLISIGVLAYRGKNEN